MSPEPAGPIDVLDALATERSAFVGLLRSLERADWKVPTECPIYDVQGVATHILGDDLSLLSRQRDSAPPGLLDVLEDGMDFRTALDRFNDRWVEAAGFFSPPLLVELLERSGEWTLDWYRAVDSDSLGEPVGFFAAAGPSPYWQIAAREYVERWVHHHQIRRAVGRPDLDTVEILQPALGAVARGLVAHLHDLGASQDDSIQLLVGLDAWTLVRHGERWVLLEGDVESATTCLQITRDDATPAFSKGWRAPEVEAAFVLEGDLDLGRRAAHAIAAFAGR
jgi:uncharacterized protein (TIGR03083 family)